MISIIVLTGLILLLLVVGIIFFLTFIFIYNKLGYDATVFLPTPAPA